MNIVRRHAAASPGSLVVLAVLLLGMSAVWGCDDEATDRAGSGGAAGAAGGVAGASAGMNGAHGGTAGTAGDAADGAAGSDGANGGTAFERDASDGNAGIDAPTQSSECLARAIAEYRVRLEGTGFNAYDGLSVQFLTDMSLGTGVGSCQARAQSTIVGGAFTVEVTNLTDGSAYPRLAAFIDIAGDGQCQDGVDFAWSSYGSVVPGALLTRTLTPNAFSAADAGATCALF